MGFPEGWTQHDAGVLIDRKLSPAAKLNFIQDVKNWLVTGTSNIPFPCGPTFPAVPFADQIQLEDEAQYPEWHKHVLGLYEKIANALDFEGQFTIFPICCPIALAIKLGLDVPALDFPSDFSLYGLSLPLLAVKLGIDIPMDLAIDFKNNLTIPPSIKLNLPIPHDFDLSFKHLIEFAVPFPKFPELLLDLMLKMPQLFSGLLAFEFGAICDVVLDAKLFGPFDPNEAVVWAVSQAVLASKTAECMVIAMTGATIGSAAAGVVGAEGKAFRVIPPVYDQKMAEDKDVRDRIVGIASSMIGESWSKDHKALEDAGDYLKAEMTYTQFVLPNVIFPSPPKEVPTSDVTLIRNVQAAHAKAQGASSCGMFVRGVYKAAGAFGPLFQKPLEPGRVINDLIDVCDNNQAKIEFSWENIPALKRGDSILVMDAPGTEHVLILTKDFPGGKDNLAEGAEGGRVDEGNPAHVGTAIKAATYEFRTQNGDVLAGRTDGLTFRRIVRIMDGERMVSGPPTDQAGS